MPNVMVPTLATVPSHLQPVPTASWEFPVISWQRETRLGSGLEMVLYDMQGHLKVFSCSTLVPSWDIPEDMVEGISPNGRTFINAPGSFCLKRDGSACYYVLWSWTMVSCQGLGRNTRGESIMRKLPDLSEQAKNVLFVTMWMLTEGWPHQWRV
jgi:hypothetical protein